MRCVRALVQKLFRSAKPEKLENHHSLFQRLRCFCCCCHRPTVAAIVAQLTDRADADRADRARCERGGGTASRLKQRCQTMSDLLLHPSLVLVPLPLSSPFPRWTLAPLLFVLGPSFSASSSFSFFFSRTHTPLSLAYSLLVSILVNPLTATS